MKNTTFIVKCTAIFRVKQCLSITIIIVLTSFLGACQLTGPSTDSSAPIKYSQYYLWLKSLSKEQVLTEEAKQKTFIENNIEGKTLCQGKLILIYSLPNTQLHHPYRAKRLLNELLLASNTMSKDNLAFTMLLRDQLNTQLYLLKKQEKLRKELDEKLIEKNNEKIATNAAIEQLNKQLNHVNQQLLLLKQIDKNINERG